MKHIMQGILMSEDLVKYYKDRAKEYEEVYEWRDPNRQGEQNLMSNELKKFLSGTDVLDVGCGTGYWTQKISETAKSIIGIDINQAVLDIASSKTYGCPTEFKLMDAYKFEFNERKFTGVIASFWLSHIRKESIGEWLEQLHKFLKPEAHVFIADNTFIEGIGGELVIKTGDPNTYKLRILNDGSKHLIVKNYFTKEELIQLFNPYAQNLTYDDVFLGKCFWWIKYSVS